MLFLHITIYMELYVAPKKTLLSIQASLLLLFIFPYALGEKNSVFPGGKGGSQREKLLFFLSQGKQIIRPNSK